MSARRWAAALGSGRAHLSQNPGFESREPRAEAEVDARAEGDVLRGVASGIETIRLGEHGRIAVRRGEQHQQPGVLGDGVFPKARRSQCPPERPLDGRVETKHLLDGRGEKLGVVTNPRHSGGVVEECLDTVAEEVRRGLVAGDEQQFAEDHDLDSCELVTGVDEQPAHQIVSRADPSIGDQAVEELEHLGGDAEIELGGRCDRQRQVVGPTLEVVSSLGRNAEQLRDDDDGKGEGDITHEVGVTSRRRGDQLIHAGLGDPSDPRFHRRDRPRCEGTTHELAQARVIRRIRADQQSERLRRAER
ncbi:MAG: hypothetical protein M5U31_15300 [Acidimicrobiia bacterium]|nr:hypothetical protein [Acidimicrobiia bacterium]